MRYLPIQGRQRLIADTYDGLRCLLTGLGIRGSGSDTGDNPRGNSLDDRLPPGSLGRVCLAMTLSRVLLSKRSICQRPCFCDYFFTVCVVETKSIHALPSSEGGRIL